LFSATCRGDIGAVSSKHEAPINIEIAPSGTACEKVVQEVFFVEKDEKTQLLDVLIREGNGPVLVFARTRHGARKLTRAVRALGHAAAELHSDRSLAQRRAALDGFKSGKHRVLIATDIAARGIDVVGIELVVNYDLPSDTKTSCIASPDRSGGMAGRAYHSQRSISVWTSGESNAHHSVFDQSK
jgi:ATP-dependent RNA helicase RhlE